MCIPQNITAHHHGTTHLRNNAAKPGNHCRNQSLRGFYVDIRESHWVYCNDVDLDIQRLLKGRLNDGKQARVSVLVVVAMRTTGRSPASV